MSGREWILNRVTLSTNLAANCKYLRGTHMEIVDGAESMILDVPAEG